MSKSIGATKFITLPGGHTARIHRKSKHYEHSLVSPNSTGGFDHKKVLFVSNSQHPGVLEGLAKLVLEHGKWCGMKSHIPQVKADYADSVLSRMTTASEAELLALSMSLRGFSKNYAANLKLAEKHVEFWKEHKSEVRSSLYWHPEATQYGVASANKLCEFDKTFYSPSFIKNSSDPEFIDFALRIYRMNSWGQGKTLLKDININTSTRNPSFLKLPIQHKSFREYLLELPVGDYHKLVGEIPKRTPEKDLIPLADEILGRTRKVNPTEYALTTYLNILKVSPLDEVHYSHWEVLQKTLFDYSEELNLVQILNELALESAQGSFTAAKRNAFIEVLFYRSHKTWVSNRRYANFIAGRLLELTGSARETYEILEGFYNNRDNTPYRDWEKYFDNWDEYKTMPGEIAAVLL